MSTQEAESRSHDETDVEHPGGNELGNRYDELIEFMFELTKRQAEWEKQQQLLADQQRALGEELKVRAAEEASERKLLNEERENLLKQKQRLDKLELQHETGRGENSETGMLASELIERLTRLETREEKVAEKLRVLVTLKQRTRQQRKSIALQLRAQKAELQSFGTSDGSSGATDKVLETLQNNLERTKVEFSEKIEALQATLAMSYDRQASLETDLLSQTNENSQLVKQLHEKEDEARAIVEENTRLRDEIAEVQSAVSTTQGNVGEDHSSLIEEMQLNLDRANDRIEQLLNENSQLKQQSTMADSVDSESGGLDWESEKARFLDRLESEEDPNSAEADDHRRSLDDVIQRTDAQLARKDEEIEELKKLLTQQSDSIGDVAVGASAISEIFDQDDVISQQRDELNHLQEEWKEKLRKAEIEISMERAKLARERAEVEERLLAASEQEAKGSNGDESGSDKHSRGKWLTRLGLRDED